jgi:hypothetical protein
MNPDEDTGPRPYTPGWKDAHGIVHIAGTHAYNQVSTECGLIIAAVGTRGRSWPDYEECLEPPTCIMCIGNSIDYLPKV